MPDPLKHEDLLIEFWETIHKTYFRPVSSQDKHILDYIKSNVLTESDKIESSCVPVFLDTGSVEAVASLTSYKYETLFGNAFEGLSKHNFANLTKHYYLTIYYYLPMMTGNKEVILVDPSSLSKISRLF